MTRKPKVKPVLAWAIYSDDELLWLHDPYYPGCKQVQIYKSRAMARKSGADIRRVLITPVKP